MKNLSKLYNAFKKTTALAVDELKSLKMTRQKRAFQRTPTLVGGIYSKKYFQERDYLDPRMIYTLKMIMAENGFKKVLDVGCGTGKLVQSLNDNGFDAWGCDNAKEAIKLAQKRAKNKIIMSEATKLPFKANSFDLITSISLIEHLTKKQVGAFLNEVKRVLTPGGLVFLVTPNYLTPIRLYQGKRWFGYSDPTHINFYTPISLSKILKSTGFKKVQFWFKTTYCLPFDWDLPLYISKLPMPIRAVFVFLFWSSPLALIRNAFWITAKKR